MNTTTLEQAAEQTVNKLKNVFAENELKSWWVTKQLLEQAAYEAARVTFFVSLDEMLDCVERGILRAALEETKGNETQAAVLLQKNRGTLRRHLAKHQLGGGV